MSRPKQGSMAYNGYTPYRGERRRRRMLLLVVFATLIGLFALAVRSRSEQRDVLEYVSAARETLVEHREIAAQVSTLLVDIDGLERQVVLDKVQSLYERALAADAKLDEVPIAPEVAVLSGYVTVATSSWTDAVGALDEAFLASVDDAQDVLVGERLLAAAFEQLRVGDRAYANVAARLVPISEEYSVNEFPIFTYINPEQINTYDAKLTAIRLRQFRQLAEYRDVKLSVTLDPLPVSEQNGVSVIPFGETFSASVVVSNNGNLTENNIVVTLTITEIAGDFVLPVSKTIDVLLPDVSSTVVFADLPLLAGQLYELVIEAPVSNDNDPASNEWRLFYRRNAGE
jgi:hypothetical protein